MLAALSSNVLTERHQFQTVSADTALEFRGDRLLRSHFVADRSRQSLDFHEISTAKQTTTWYSPKAENNMVPTADLTIVREYMECDILNSAIDDADLGMVCSFKHKLMLQKVDEVDKDSWMLAMSYFDKRAILLWHCRRRAMSGNNRHCFFDLILDRSELVFGAMHDLKAWVACSFRWRSWV